MVFSRTRTRVCLKENLNSKQRKVRKIYRIYDYGRYYLIANTRAGKKHHSHFSTMGKNKQSVKDTCHMLIRFMNEQKIPKSTFLLNSAIRIVSDKHYKNRLLCELERRLENKNG